MRRVIVDTDTAGDDTQALALAVLTDRLSVEAVTVVAGNVPFDRQVENAKYTLSLVDAADTPVYEGARSPLVKSHEHATEIHGEGGLGGDLHPETGIDSAAGFAPEEIVARCRESPGEITLLCIGPLTNLALAHAREETMLDLVDEVWVMGGAVESRGNVTPAAEFNVWADPDAAKRVTDAFDVTLVDWGLCLRTALGPDRLEDIDAMDTDLADFFGEVTKVVRDRGEADGLDGITQPDGLTAALLAYPELRERVETHPVEVDEREGLTRGYTSVDFEGVTGEPADTAVVEAADGERFAEVMLRMLRERDPDGVFE
ncbi:inosine-uridine preferring nucleoside hydrolase [Halosimplex carlsbadense 2-9-1]|uniref:Inosine-uridine preferring nucleoside hydrolase n=1 Tax=Halosimplex carlsbadense 2-9-1 TaxID=797114 RepID=M0CBF5_9EURY|nr:nucleoside hydrolase [Halosimplex carlsbadense]ELZ20611.1 inosine-uridine preferring nucleoside hydrolase [Halosimplex carlsbadense 2-9-1]